MRLRRGTLPLVLALLSLPCVVGAQQITRDNYFAMVPPTPRIVHGMNGIVARFAGAFSEKFPSGAVEAPIFEHRRFEHLEMGDE